jgi:hypothetical protein
MKPKKPLLMTLIFILLITASIVLLVRHFHIKDFCIIKPSVLYTSAQPRGMDYYRLLYRYHIATIVNVRSPYEHRERNWYNEEITWTRTNGINYFELTLVKTNPIPDKQTQETFLAIMADKKNLPVLLHGGSNDRRVAMLTAVWFEKSRTCTVEEILSIVQKVCDCQELTQDERKFIRGLVK